MLTTCSKRAGGTPAPDGYAIVYCGRPSPLGNPFDGERTEAIELFRAHLRAEYKKKTGPVYEAFMDLVRRYQAGENLALQCWCKPLACHTDVIKDAIEKVAEKST